MNEEFKKLRFNAYKGIYWSANITLGTIPSLVLNNITSVAYITISAPNLYQIHSRAFSGVSVRHTIQRITLQGDSAIELSNYPGTDYDLKAFLNLMAITDITFNVSKINHISVDAFINNVYTHPITINLNKTQLSDNSYQSVFLNLESNDTILLCNVNGTYDGSWGIRRWPPVEPNHYSTAKCANGRELKWMCLPDGHFNSSGPEGGEPCWLDELVNKTIESVDDMTKSLQTLVDNTRTNNSLNSMSHLGKVMKVVINLQTFLQVNGSQVEPSIAVDVSDNFVHTYSQVIDQSFAWSNGSDTERLETASQLLLYIQYTAFSSNCYLSPLNDTRKFVSDNVFEMHYFNKTDKILFEYNSSSILIPDGIVFSDADYSQSCQKNSDFGALIQGLEKHLSKELMDKQEINTEIIAFSINNANGTHELNDGKNVRVSLKHKSKINLGDAVDCVFWDFEKNEWSSEGCKVITSASNRDTTVCECKHLTNFAALMDTTGREENGSAKNAVTLPFGEALVGNDFFCWISSPKHPKNVL
ncbi:unnamed protein product [Oppiella nova]|uniref:GAIN-B domain-containing protein n=1 Tax=Oppiella nova TaxID=334625 RepID=A0A7R9LFE1_9ACAR|nr:unnamed protein product [Oppiella nova]CAG2163004.1 unnamed protein product [Oppiella nova]